jgi:hypothetical protein
MPSFRVLAERDAGTTKVKADVRGHYKHSQLRRGSGFGRRGAVAAAMQRAATSPDLPLEEALSADESARLDKLHSALMRELDVDSVPTDWRRSFFTRARLLTYLRADRGDVKRAAARASTGLAFCKEMWKRALEWEAQPDTVKRIYDLAAWGPHGYDKRGCSVTYYRLGQLDLGGLVRETSFDIFLQWDAYCCLMTYDLYVREGLAHGVGYTLGKVVVADVGGLNLTRALKTVRVASKQNKSFPGGEHPFPELTRCIYVTNMPWVADHLWQLCKRLMPARDVARVRIYGQGKGAHKKFLSEFEQLVEVEQVPELFGGTNTEAWAYGMGGDVPSNAKDVMGGGDVSPGIVDATPTPPPRPATPSAGQRLASVGARISHSISHEVTEISHTVQGVSAHAVHTVQHVSREISNLSPRFSHRRKHSKDSKDRPFVPGGRMTSGNLSPGERTSDRVKADESAPLSNQCDEADDSFRAYLSPTKQ